MPSRILIVEDEPAIADTLVYALKTEGFAPEWRTTGREALAALAAGPFALVILDIGLPDLSGFEVCKTLKRDANTRQIMILMVTALNELGDIERAVSAGCDDFLSKPVNKIELLTRVQNLLKLRQLKRALKRPPPEPPVE